MRSPRSSHGDVCRHTSACQWLTAKSCGEVGIEGVVVVRVAGFTAEHGPLVIGRQVHRQDARRLSVTWEQTTLSCAVTGRQSVTLERTTLCCAVTGRQSVCLKQTTLCCAVIRRQSVTWEQTALCCAVTHHTHTHTHTL